MWFAATSSKKKKKVVWCNHFILLSLYNIFIFMQLFLSICHLNALKCVKTQELFRPQIKNYSSIDFTLTYTKCGIE